MFLADIIKIVKQNEDWLIHRILHYSKQHDYTKYTSTLAEAWRLSISGLSASLIEGVHHFHYYQYARETLLKMKIFDINIMSPEALESEIKLAKEQKRNQFYFKHRLGNGEIRDVEVFSGPIIVAEKQLLYSIIHDVTDRKQMEEAFKKSNQELDDFAYIASHDLREPLRGISRKNIKIRFS